MISLRILQYAFAERGEDVHMLTAACCPPVPLMRRLVQESGGV
jgi:hypothetical protein